MKYILVLLFATLSIISGFSTAAPSKQNSYGEIRQWTPELTNMGLLPNVMNKIDTQSFLCSDLYQPAPTRTRCIRYRGGDSSYWLLVLLPGTGVAAVYQLKSGVYAREVAFKKVGSHHERNDGLALTHFTLKGPMESGCTLVDNSCTIVARGQFGGGTTAVAQKGSNQQPAANEGVVGVAREAAKQAGRDLKGVGGAIGSVLGSGK